MNLQLEGKKALVTGGGGGLGAAICQLLAQEGVKVAVADLNLEAAQRVADGIGGTALRMDVASKDDIESGVAQAADRLGGLQIVVNNVGLTLPDYLPDIDDQDIATTFDINMRAPLLLTRAVAPYLSDAGWGRLIYIGSGSGIKASAGLALYSASKYFLHGLCVAAGLELGRQGITANILCPSDIYPEGDTPAGSWLNPKLVEISLKKDGAADFAELKSKRMAKTPAGRSCRVEDVAALTVFIASPLADFINAQVIGVNGGALPN